MRRVLIMAAVALALVLMALPLVAQTSVTITPTDAIAFDYADADIATYAVTEFNYQVDGGAWVSMPLSTKFQTVGGIGSYKWIPTPTSGTHTVAFRAMNAGGAGPASSPFAFTLVANPPATAPSNVRKVPR